MRTTNVTELRKNLFNTIDSVIKYNEPVQVTTKNGNAVLLSEEDRFLGFSTRKFRIKK